MEAEPDLGIPLMRTRLALLAAALLLATAGPALAAGKGSTLFSIQIGHGQADLVSPAGTGYITSFAISELEPKLELSHLFKDDYAFNVSAGIGMFSETDKPGTAAAPGDPDLETKVSSFYVRVGGDRIVSVGERATFYFGPGVEYWSGKYEYTTGSNTEESEATTRISLSGRIGGTMMLGESWGFTCNAGHRIGMASAKWDGAEANWTPSSSSASGGLLFVFGGD